MCRQYYPLLPHRIPSKLTYAVHGDVDSSDQYCNPDLDSQCLHLVGEKNSDSVDDDLEQELNLERPCRYWSC